MVRLNRRRGGEEGIYRCEISDSVNVTHTIYIGVYTANTSTRELQCLKVLLNVFVQHCLTLLMGIMGVVHMMRCCVVIPKLPLEIGSENVGQREVGGLRCG